MNILFLEQYAKISGGQLCLLELIEGLDRDIYKPHVVVPEAGELTQRLTELNAESTVLPVGTLTQGEKSLFDAFKLVLDSIMLVPKLARVIREQKIDLIYANAPRTFLWGTLAAKLTGKPIVWHLHLILNGSKEKLLARTLLKLGVDQVICVSQAVADSFITPSYQPKQLSIIYNGTDLGKYSPATSGAAFRREFGLETNDPAIGVIGQIAAAKGQETFIKAAKVILQKFPRAKFFLIGGTSYSTESEEFLAEQKKFVQESGMEGQVIFTGQRSDIPGILAGLDIVVLPSFVPEACPRVLIETMASGKVIIASERGAVPELVAHGEDGFLFSPGNERELANIVESLLCDFSLKEKMGFRARQKAETKFSLAGYVQNIVRVLKGFGN